MLSFLIVVTFQYDLALERGFNILTSSLAPASIAAGSFFGRLVAGFLSDYVDRNKILFSVFLGQALSVFIILNSSTIYGFILFGITFGFCYAGWIPIFPSKLKDFYGKANSGVIDFVKMKRVFERGHAKQLNDYRKQKLATKYLPDKSPPAFYNTANLIGNFSNDFGKASVPHFRLYFIP